MPFVEIVKSFSFPKKKDKTPKSLEQPACQSTGLHHPHKGSSTSRVRPSPDPVAKVTTRVLLDEQYPQDCTAFQNPEKSLRNTSFFDSSSNSNLISPSSSATSPLSPTTDTDSSKSSSPLRRLNDLNLQKKMLRDRFFSSDSDSEREGQVKGHGFKVSASNGFSSPIGVSNGISNVPITNGFSPPQKPTEKTPSPATIARRGAKTPSPGARLALQSNIPRPLLSNSNSSPKAQNERPASVMTPGQSGIPRLYSPLSSRGRGQSPNLRVQQITPKIPVNQNPVSLSSGRRETEEVNSSRFRVDSSYVLNKNKGFGSSGGLNANVNRAKPVGVVASRVISATQAPGQGQTTTPLASGVVSMGRKSTAARTLSLTPYKSHINVGVGSPSGYLVRKPEVTRPFYTMLYQSPGGQKGTNQGQGQSPKKTGPLLPAGASVSRTMLDKDREANREEGLILRSVTWTKEDDRNVLLSIQVENNSNNASKVEGAPPEQSELTQSQNQPKKSQNEGQSEATAPMEFPRSRTKPDAIATSNFNTDSPVPQSQSQPRASHSAGSEAAMMLTKKETKETPKNPNIINTPSPKPRPRSGPMSRMLGNPEGGNNINSNVNVNIMNNPTLNLHRLSAEKLFHSSTNSSVLSSNDPHDLSSDSDYLIDDEIEDQPDLITTTTTLKTDNNSFQLASNIGSSLESLQIESDYSDDDLLHHKDDRVDLSGLTAKDGSSVGGASDRSVVISGTESIEGLDKIEVISVHSEDSTGSNLSEKVDRVKSEGHPALNNPNHANYSAPPALNPNSNININTGLKSDSKAKRRSTGGVSRGTPTNKMVLDRTMSYELRSSHRSVALPKKIGTVELAKHAKYPGVGAKNGTLTALNKAEETRKQSSEDLLTEVQDLKRSLFQLKTVLEEQNRREKEKDEIINKLLQEVDLLKKQKGGDCESLEIKDPLKMEADRKILEESGVEESLKKKVEHPHRQSHHSIAKSVIKKS